MKREYNFYMVKYEFHITDNLFDSEYDYDGYFLDHEEAEVFIKENEDSGNIVTINKDYQWIHVNNIPLDIDSYFKDVEKEERRFWERYLNGELGIIPLGITK